MTQTSYTVLRRIPVTDVLPGDVLVTAWDAPRVVEVITAGELTTVLHLTGFGQSHMNNAKRVTVRRPL